MGSVEKSLRTSNMFKAPKAPAAPAAPPPPPQATKAPSVLNTQNALAGMGQAGGSPGVSQTFLTGAGGVDPSTLTLGKTLLLGG